MNLTSPGPPRYDDFMKAFRDAWGIRLGLPATRWMLEIGAWAWPVDMWNTCEYVSGMPIMIQIRNVPDDLHRQLKARAALESLSLSEFLLREVRRVAERPSLPELRRRLDQRERVRPRVSPARAVRAERDRK